VRHSLRAEAVLVLVLYRVYEAARGLVVGDTARVVENAVPYLFDEHALAQASDRLELVSRPGTPIRGTA